MNLRSPLGRRVTLPTIVLVVAVWPVAVGAASGDDDEAPRAGAVEAVVVTAHRLDTARAAIEPSLGASTYSISNEAVENRPGGETTNLNQVLLQVPGVSQGGGGQLRIRGSSGELQYRINNVILPSGLTDLGETLSTRMAENIQLVTGALPAQYGLAVAGVVNITTKSGVYYDGGQAELYGGSQGMFEPALEYAGSVGGTNVFATGSYIRNDVGLPAPDGSFDPLHDYTEQLEGLTYVDRPLTSNSRLSLVLGGSNESFQIPNQRGLNALTDTTFLGFVRPLNVGGVSKFSSERLNERQRETNGFGILSYLWTDDDATLQVSVFGRDSSFAFRPDNTGDLLFYGVSQSIAQHDLAFGLQLEGALEVGPSHTVRAGIIASTDRTRTTVQSRALAVDAQGRQVTNNPSSVTSTSTDTEQLVSAYLQDEWHPFESVTLNAGLRFDSVNVPADERQLSPRINLVWTPAPETVVHIGYARYFVPPPVDNSSAMIAQLTGTTGMQPTLSGSALRSETDNYYDAGIQRTVGGLVLGFDGYWREAANLIDDGFFGGLPTQRPFNYRTGRIRGLEFSATFAEGPFSAWSNLTVSEAEGSGIVSNQFYFSAAELAFVDSRAVRLQHDQTYTVSGGASYHWGDLLLSGDLLYGSGQSDMTSRFTRADAHLSDHLQINLAGVYHVASVGGRPLDLRLDVVNVFDRKYQIQNGNGPDGGLPQWGARRGIFVGIEQSF